MTHHISLKVNSGYQRSPSSGEYKPGPPLVHALMVRPKHLSPDGESVETTPLFIDGHYVQLALKACYEEFADVEGREESPLFQSRLRALIEALDQYFAPLPTALDTPSADDDGDEGGGLGHHADVIRECTQEWLSLKEARQYELESGDILVTARAHRLFVYRFLHPRDVLSGVGLGERAWRYVVHKSLQVIRLEGLDLPTRLTRSAALAAWLQGEAGVDALMEVNQRRDQDKFWRLPKKLLSAIKPPEALWSPLTLRALSQSQSQRMEAKLKRQLLEEHSRLINLENTRRAVAGEPFIPHLFGETMVCREMVLSLCRGGRVEMQRLIPSRPLSVTRADMMQWHESKGLKPEYIESLRSLFEELSLKHAEFMFIPGVSLELNQRRDDFFFQVILSLMIGRSIEMARGVMTGSESFLHGLSAQIADLVFSDGGEGLVDERAAEVQDEVEVSRVAGELSPLETQQLMRSHFRQLQLAYQRLEETIAKLG
jgi:hypothetical protein